MWERPPSTYQTWWDDGYSKWIELKRFYCPRVYIKSIPSHLNTWKLKYWFYKRIIHIVKKWNKELTMILGIKGLPFQYLVHLVSQHYILPKEKQLIRGRIVKMSTTSYSKELIINFKELIIDFSKNDEGKHTTSVSSPTIWNSLSITLSSSTSTTSPTCSHDLYKQLNFLISFVHMIGHFCPSKNNNNDLR